MFDSVESISSIDNDLTRQLREEINSFFDQDILFSLIFGSRARHENRIDSDIDLMIVFKKDIPNQEKISTFKRTFINLHRHNNLNADLNYPGEYISQNKLSNALKGSGFILDGSKVDIPLLSETDWNRLFDYRQWLCAIGGISKFINGDQDQYNKVKKEAQRTILLLHLLNQEDDCFNISSITNTLTKKGRQYLGYCNTPVTRNYISEFSREVLENFIQNNIVKKSENDTYKLIRDNALKELPLLTNKEDYDLKKNFLGNLTTEKDKNLFTDSLGIGLDFTLNNEKVINYCEPEKIREQFVSPIPIEGEPITKILSEFKETIAKGSVHQSSPRYLAFPDSGNSIAALHASILMNFINQNQISVEKSSPTGTFVEIQIINWLRKLVGYSKPKNFPSNILEVGGIGTPGGTMSNTIALLLARCKAFPNSRKYGLSLSKKKPILLITDSTINHYSHISSCWWLGLGEDNIVKVKANKNYKINLEDLERKIKKYKKSKNEEIVALIVLAGDSRTTQVDNLEKIAEITERYNVWLHVDACHGGALLFSNNHKYKLDGIENANSISLDPHKGLGIPYSSSFVLFRDPSDMDLLSQSSDVTISNKKFDLGKITPFLGSRPFDSLKLWFLIKNLGLEGLGKLVDYRFELAEDWYNLIKDSRYFTNMSDVTLNSVVFSVSPQKIRQIKPKLNLSLKQVNFINKKIHDIIYREGYICIHSFDLYDFGEKLFTKEDKVRCLGVMFGNPDTVKSEFVDYVNYLDKKASIIVESL